MTATYERACSSGFDSEYQRELANAVTAAIFASSKVSDANAAVLRTGEIASALIDVLAFVLALSPSASRTRQARQQLMKELSRRLQRRIAEAVADPVVQDLMRRSFNGSDVGGRA
jgi:hypothetical protein